MERIGYDLKHGYIWNRQSDNGDLVYLNGIGWVRKTA
jgi:hypothetical protein